MRPAGAAPDAREIIIALITIRFQVSVRKTIKEINEGGVFFNNWIYQQAKELLDKGKLVGLLGGDHSTPLGLYKALAERHEDFGILHIDAHCDLREAYEGFNYSHASIMYNALKEIPQIKNIMQFGVRDFGQDEWEYIKNSEYRVITYFDKEETIFMKECITFMTIKEDK